jgi:glycine cleavage system H lipoate-binding protein
MIPHTILTLYHAKPLEYFIAAAFLLLFIPFWRYVQGGRQASVRRPAAAPRRVGWFAVPEHLFFHPGHTWARVESDGLVALGLDDFAEKLVGPLTGARLPAPGASLAQGEPAWSLVADGRTVDMLSPVAGVVVEVNGSAVREGRPIADPYGAGWLVRVRPTRLGADLKGLLKGEFARRWMATAADAFRRRLSPELGLVYEDGGAPIDGLARSLDPEGWDRLARECFLTE